ncbi:MAG: hypothetical protein HY815_08655 [Candidatus Riflebacteria bacterium]|nr:hypothetical protein [Candidatus Riflebacteria bacterium]
MDAHLITTTRESVVVDGRPAQRLGRQQWSIRFVVLESPNVPFEVDRVDIVTTLDLEDVPVGER